MTPRALVRQVSVSFEDALRGDTNGPVPDPGLACTQHAAYRRALRDIGLDCRVLPPLDEHPDACFVEDRLIAGWGRGLVTYSRAPSRRDEAATIAVAAAACLDVTIMQPSDSGGLDGGDVIRLGRTLLVGLSERTDEYGLAVVQDWVADLDVTVVPVPLANGLHLKCDATPLDANTLLCVEGWPYRSALPAGVQVIEVPRSEAYAANAVATNSGVLVSAGFPVTASRVAATGRRVVPVEMSAFRCADGSLTCLSVILDQP